MFTRLSFPYCFSAHTYSREGRIIDSREGGGDPKPIYQFLVNTSDTITTQSLEFIEINSVFFGNEQDNLLAQGSQTTRKQANAKQIHSVTARGRHIYSNLLHYALTVCTLVDKTVTSNVVYKKGPADSPQGEDSEWV